MLYPHINKEPEHLRRILIRFMDIVKFYLTGPATPVEQTFAMSCQTVLCCALFPIPYFPQG